MADESRPLRPATPVAGAAGSMSARQRDLEFLRRVLIAAGIAVLLAAIWALSDILLLVFGAVLFAVVLRTIARPIEEQLDISPRTALLLAVVALASIVVAVALSVGPELVRQMRGVVDRLPQAIEQLAAELGFASPSEIVTSPGPATSLGALASRLAAWGSTVFGGLASLVLVLVGGLYIAADPKMYRAGALKLVPAAVQPQGEAVIDTAGEALSLWLKGQVLAMLLVGVLTAVGLWVAGVPSPFALGLIAGLAEFVPFVGPIVAVIPALVIAASESPHLVAWVLAVYFVVQQLEGYVITPVIADRMVSIPPAVALFAVFAMGVLFGPLGLLFAVPLAIVLDVTIRRLYVHELLGKDVAILGEPAEEKD